MAKASLLDRVRRIALALPDTEESTRLGGSPHFYVRGKIFCGCGEEDGAAGIGVKVGLELQAMLIERPGITVAKYVGRYGWIDVEESALQGEAELRQLIERSYALIAGGTAAGKAARPSRGSAKAKAAPKSKAAANPKAKAKTKASSRTRSRGKRS